LANHDQLIVSHKSVNPSKNEKVFAKRVNELSDRRITRTQDVCKGSGRAVRAESIGSET
jgi:hypothetical protein